MDCYKARFPGVTSGDCQVLCVVESKGADLPLLEGHQGVTVAAFGVDEQDVAAGGDCQTRAVLDVGEGGDGGGELLPRQEGGQKGADCAAVVVGAGGEPAAEQRDLFLSGRFGPC